MLHSHSICCRILFLERIYKSSHSFKCHICINRTFWKQFPMQCLRGTMAPFRRRMVTTTAIHKSPEKKPEEIQLLRTKGELKLLNGKDHRKTVDKLLQERHQFYNTLQNMIDYLTDSQWEDIKTKFLFFRSRLEKKNRSMWYVEVMDMLNSQVTCKSLYKYLQNKRLPIPPILIAQYIKILGQGDCRNYQEMYDLYDTLCKDLPHFDKTIVTQIVQGLCNTPRWLECVDLLNSLDAFEGNFKLSNNRIFMFVVAAAIKNKDWKTMEVLMNRMSRDHDRLPPICENIEGFRYLSCEDLPGVGKFIDTLKDMKLMTSKEALQDLIFYFQSIAKPQWNCDFVKMPKSGDGCCPKCGHILQQETLTEMDTAELAELFFHKAIIGNDVHQKSNPKEVEDFLRFCDSKTPFDYVLDGLNIALMISRKMGGRVLLEFLYGMGEEIETKKILVVGKVFMKKKWPEMELIRKMCHVYLVDQRSLDDVFAIYAALRSGPECYLFTRDILRDTSFLLGDDRHKFHKWQRLCQFTLTKELYNQQKAGRSIHGVSKDMKGCSYIPEVQKDDRGWHIPIHEERLSHDSKVYEWLCLHRKNPLPQNQFGTLAQSSDS